MLGHQPSFKHYVRVVFTYLALIITVTGGTYFVVQLARGYQVNLQQQQLELTGLIRFESNPDATVIVDGENTSEQTPARLSLVEGQREIRLTQAGYQEWIRSVRVIGGTVDTITYPFLIPFDVEAGTRRALDVSDIDQFSVDSAGQLAALATAERLSIYQLLEERLDEPYRDFNLGDTLRVSDSAEVDKLIWAESGQELLVKIVDESDVSWLVVDVEEQTVADITQTVGQLSPQGFVVDVEQRVLLSSGDGELWLLSTDDQQLQILTRDATSFAFNSAAVVWHDESQTESLQLWTQAGSRQVPVLADVSDPIKLEISSYSNQINVAYTQNKSTRVIVNAAEAPFERAIDSIETVQSISPGGRFVLGRSAKGLYVTHDIDKNLTHEFELVDELETLGWSGTHHFVARGDSGVYVVDYEGSNQRRVSFRTGSQAVLNAQKTAVFTLAGDQLLITPLRN